MLKHTEYMPGTGGKVITDTRDRRFVAVKMSDGGWKIQDSLDQIQGVADRVADEYEADEVIGFWLTVVDNHTVTW